MVCDFKTKRLKKVTQKQTDPFWQQTRLIKCPSGQKKKKSRDALQNQTTDEIETLLKKMSNTFQEDEQLLCKP